MNNIHDKNDMKRFYWILLICQTIIYGSMCLTIFIEGLIVNVDKILWIVLCAFGYGLSVLLFFIIPMIKEYRKK